MNGVQKSSAVILFNLKLWRSFTTDFYGCCDVWFYHGFSRNFTLKLCIHDASSGPCQTGQASLIGRQLGDQLYDAENKIDTIASDTWYSRSSHYVGWHDTEGYASLHPRLRATRSCSGIRPFRSCCRWSRWLSASPRLCGGFAGGIAWFWEYCS